jgi:hypothetical protein
MSPDAPENRRKDLLLYFGFSVRLQEQKMTRSSGMASMSSFIKMLFRMRGLPDVYWYSLHWIDLFFTLSWWRYQRYRSSPCFRPRSFSLSSSPPHHGGAACGCNPPFYTPKSIKRSHSIVSCSHIESALQLFDQTTDGLEEDGRGLYKWRGGGEM